MRLLVSVKNLAEATTAAKCGVDIIDVKDPSRGSLGAASSMVLARIARHCRPNNVLSAAVGELIDFESDDFGYLNGYSFAKIGLASCVSQPDWRGKWRAWAKSVSPFSQPVAVAYVDFRECRAPEPLQIAEQAYDADCQYFLVDTYHKNGRGLFDHLTPVELAHLVNQVQGWGMLVAVAGSLDATHIASVAAIGANIFAVRGAACRLMQRNASIVPEKITALQKQICQTQMLHSPERPIVTSG